MTRVPTPASLADVMRSLARCGGTTDTAIAQAIFDALGWPAVSRAQEIAVMPNVIAGPRPDTDSVEDDEEIGDSSPREPAGHQQRRSIPSALRTILTPQPSQDDDCSEIGPLPLPDPKAHRPLYDMPIEPLLAPHLSRAMLGRLSAVRLPRGELDVAELVAAIARGGLPRKLPRRPLSTLGPGLQLLIDTSPDMQPFHEDVVQLYRGLKRTVGADRIEVWNFEGCPARGVTGKRMRGGIPALRRPYSPPRAGTPVLAVTDLGVVRADLFERAHRTREWLDFRRYLVTRGTPLSVLSPYPADRLGDNVLARLLRIVLWDRETGVRQVPPAPLVRGFDD